jgi:hypothetical protein
MSAPLKLYRTYRYMDKNPVIDKVRTVLQDEGLYSKKQRKMLHQISGVAEATFEGWFEGDTRDPRHATIMATLTSIGYEEQFVKAKEVDFDKELKIAAAWLVKQNSGPKRKPAKKANGHKGTRHEETTTKHRQAAKYRQARHRTGQANSPSPR